jgi:pimeloyl-ACP methyl ester carboxylesterase
VAFGLPHFAADEADFLDPVLSLPDEPFTLIGHSYGGAVALRAALANPKRVRKLVLYEAHLVRGYRSRGNFCEGSGEDSTRCRRRGRSDRSQAIRNAAAQFFLDTGWAPAPGSARRMTGKDPSPRRW